MPSARLPGVSGVIGELLLLDQTVAFGRVDAAHVVPVGMADDDVGHVFEADASELHGFVGRR
jgi:hypothetical protein